MSQTQTPSKVQPARRPSPPPTPIQREDRSRFLLAAGLWALAVLALALFAYRQFFAAPNGPGLLSDPDAMDYAQIARNMANGHGYATGILRPLAVSGFAGPDKSGTAPDISRAPLYPFLLMTAFMAHGGHGGDTAVVGLSLALFLLTVVAAYRLGRTFFPAPDQAWIALLAAGLYGGGGEALNRALEAQPVMLATLCVTALLIALHNAAETPERPAGFGGAVRVGFLLGLCYLTQYSLLLLALPVLPYLFYSRAPRRAWAGVGGCVLGFLLAAGPWMVRNAVVSHGDPLFTLLFYGVMAQTPDYPGATTIYRSVMPAVGPLAYFATHLPDMLAKVGRGLTFYRDHLLQAFNVFLLAAAAASLLWRASDARVSAVRACAVFGMLGIVVASSLFQPAVQMIAPFAPLVAVAAVGFAFSLVTQQGWDRFSQRTALWALGLLVGVGSLFQLYGQKPLPSDPIAQGMVQLTTYGGLRPIDNATHSPSDAVIADAPWEVTWRADVPAIWLPANNEAFQATVAAASQSGVATTAMLLTPEIADYTADPDEAPAWVQLAKNPLAYDTYVAQTQLYAALFKRHDPRVSQYTPAQVSQSLNAQFAASYGPISDMVGAFQAFDASSPGSPRNPSVAEADRLPSTLFLRRSLTPGL